MPDSEIELEWVFFTLLFCSSAQFIVTLPLMKSLTMSLSEFLLNTLSLLFSLFLGGSRRTN